ncbi:MAG TPA: RNA polymerase sigma factor [Rhizobiales bacterium]|nr:RNA polymerase sigma factor [Hyphomicrobiales bacterium]
MKLFSGHNDIRSAFAAELPHLRRFARGLVGDAALADDLVQDTIERALVKVHLFDRSQNPKNWLFRILRNLSINHYRSSQRKGEHVEFTQEIEGQAFTGPEQDHGLAMRDLSGYLMQLPASQREVLLLISLEELSYAEAADVLQIPVGTVMSRLSRARKQLRQIMNNPAQPHLRRIK